jgi:hypothetical protein
VQQDRATLAGRTKDGEPGLGTLGALSHVRWAWGLFRPRPPPPACVPDDVAPRLGLGTRRRVRRTRGLLRRRSRDRARAGPDSVEWTAHRVVPAGLHHLLYPLRPNRGWGRPAPCRRLGRAPEPGGARRPPRRSLSARLPRAGCCASGTSRSRRAPPTAVPRASSPARFDVFISTLAFPASIARDPSCQCWAVSNILSYVTGRRHGARCRVTIYESRRLWSGSLSPSSPAVPSDAYTRDNAAAPQPGVRGPPGRELAPDAAGGRTWARGGATDSAGGVLDGGDHASRKSSRWTGPKLHREGHRAHDEAAPAHLAAAVFLVPTVRRARSASLLGRACPNGTGGYVYVAMAPQCCAASGRSCHGHYRCARLRAMCPKRASHDIAQRFTTEHIGSTLCPVRNATDSRACAPRRAA